MLPALGVDGIARLEELLTNAFAEQQKSASRQTGATHICNALCKRSPITKATLMPLQHSFLRSPFPVRTLALNLGGACWSPGVWPKRWRSSRRRDLAVESAQHLSSLRC